MTENAGPRAAKLPLFATVKAAYALTWANLGALGLVAAVTGPLLFVVLFAVNWLVWQYRDAIDLPSVLFYMLPPVLASALIGALAAIAWHRRLLLAEPVTAGQLLRPDRRTFRYAGWVVLLAFGAMLVVVAISLATFDALNPDASPATAPPSSETDAAVSFDWSETAPWIAGLFIVFSALSYPAIRLMLILPAIAISDSAAKAGCIWRATQGNFWRLYWGTLATTAALIPWMLLGFAGEGRESSALASAIFEAVWLIIGLVFLSFLSLAYRHFFPSGAAGGHTPRAD